MGVGSVLSISVSLRLSLSLLWKSQVKRVYCIGRRGPMQATFTIKELREMTRLENCVVKFRDRYVV